MKNIGKGTRLAALALAMTIGAGSALAGSEKVDTSTAKTATTSVFTSVQTTKAGTVITHQIINGVDQTLEWKVPADWIDPGTGTINKGLLERAFDFLVDLVKGSKPDDGGGGGSTNNCNVSVSGAQVVVIGNLNCGGSQTGTSGSGSGSGGGGSGSGHHAE
ncbi:MAG: hypothetical protein K8W52_09225 [Deltaproteobacteria bacterium]|nr:hypothetical protein [Deltaproteobacteria bacterium]